MERNDIAYVINTTPKYFYILELHLTLLKRYAPNMKWPVYLATEDFDNPIIQIIKNKYNIDIIHLEEENSSFISSRKRTLELLPYNIRYVLMIQEDFLLERYVDENEITQSLKLMDENDSLLSVRYMPCPGPSDKNLNYIGKWRYITREHDTYLFSYQATMWKRKECLEWYSILENRVASINFKTTLEKNNYEIRYNIGENSEGQKLFFMSFPAKIHIGYIRIHNFPNGVYMCPWPYRPTAIVHGILQPFAIELAQREMGITLH
jgi:hypothetical protein